MCWGIFPFLVPCLSRGIIWADSEQPVRVKYVSNPSCGLFKDRVSCVLGLLPQKLIIFLSRWIKAMLQKDPCVSCVCVCVCVSSPARLLITQDSFKASRFSRFQEFSFNTHGVKVQADGGTCGRSSDTQPGGCSRNHQASRYTNNVSY